MKGIKLLLFLIYTFQVIKNQDNQTQYLYRCGVNDININPKPIESVAYKEEDKRGLQGEEFKDFHIYLDLIHFKNDIIKYHFEEYEDIFIKSLEKAVETLETL